MNILDIQKHFKDGNFNSVYIFIGNDLSLMNNYINKIHKVYGGKLIRPDTLLEVWAGLTQRSLFATSEKNIYVVRDDSDVKKNEKLWSKFDSVKNGILILIYTDLQKTTKMYKTLSDIIVEFNHLTLPQLTNYIMNKLKDVEVIDREVASYLATLCDCDLGRVDNEIDKILQLDLNTDCNIYEELDSLVYSTTQFNVFDLIKGIVKKDYKLVVENLNLVEDPKSGINRMGLLTLLYNKFCDISKVIGLPWEKDIEKRTGVKYFIAKDIWTNCKYEPISCLKAMRLIQDTESGIKQGRYLEIQSVSRCILTILSLK